jgi:hypothetical protein
MDVYIIDELYSIIDYCYESLCIEITHRISDKIQENIDNNIIDTRNPVFIKTEKYFNNLYQKTLRIHENIEEKYLSPNAFTYITDNFLENPVFKISEIVEENVVPPIENPTPEIREPNKPIINSRNSRKSRSSRKSRKSRSSRRSRKSTAIK